MTSEEKSQTPENNTRKQKTFTSVALVTKPTRRVDCPQVCKLVSPTHSQLAIVVSTSVTPVKNKLIEEVEDVRLTKRQCAITSRTLSPAQNKKKVFTRNLMPYN